MRHIVRADIIREFESAQCNLTLDNDKLDACCASCLCGIRLLNYDAVKSLFPKTERDYLLSEFHSMLTIAKSLLS